MSGQRIEKFEDLIAWQKARELTKNIYRVTLVPGEYLEVELEDDRLVLTPKMLVEKRFAEGLKDIKEGRGGGPFKTSRAAIRTLRTRNE